MLCPRFVGDSHVATMYWDAGPHPPREERDNFSGASRGSSCKVERIIIQCVLCAAYSDQTGRARSMTINFH